MQRELARRTHFQHRTVQLALDDLVAAGFATRIVGGRDYLVALNREHRLANTLIDLFRREAEHFLELRRSLLQVLSASAQGLSSASLFGSAARGEEEIGSDLDLLLIARSESARQSSLDAVSGARDSLQKQFGATVRPIAYVLSDARRL